MASESDPTVLRDAGGGPRPLADLVEELLTTEGPLPIVAAGDPVLRHSRRALNGEKVVEVSRSVFRADKYTLWVQIGQDY